MKIKNRFRTIVGYIINLCTLQANDSKTLKSEEK